MYANPGSVTYRINQHSSQTVKRAHELERGLDALCLTLLTTQFQAGFLAECAVTRARVVGEGQYIAALYGIEYWCILNVSHTYTRERRALELSTASREVQQRRWHPY